MSTTVPKNKHPVQKKKNFNLYKILESIFISSIFKNKIQKLFFTFYFLHSHLIIILKIAIFKFNVKKRHKIEI